MSTENIRSRYHTRRALELLIASQKEDERNIDYSIPPDIEHDTEHNTENTAERDTEYDTEHATEYDIEHATEHDTEKDKNQDDKSIARKNYFLLTFPVMVEVTASGKSRFCTPYIFSLDDTLESMQERIQKTFGIGEWSTLKVVWAGSGVDYPSIGEDRELSDSNTPAILRLLRQRGGVDKLVAEEGPLPRKGG